MTKIDEQLAEALNIAKFTEDYTPSADLQISEYMTADGYEVHVMTNNYMHIQWDMDVYYYQPPFDDIIERIKDLDSDAIVYVSDLETYLPEYEVENYLEEYNDKLLDNLNVENYDN
jgi:hypothetical protein